MKLLLVLVAATFLTLPRLQAVMYTYEGFVQSVQSGNWSINGLQVGAAFQAHVELADELVGQDLTAAYLTSGVHPVRMDFIVAGESIYLSPYYFLEATVNSPYDFGMRGDGFGFGSSWRMFGSGGLEGSNWGASADQDGGPTFTASANFIPSTDVPDLGNTGALLLIGTGSLFVYLQYRKAKVRTS